MRVLLYGESGTGKTTLWATFPGPILCLVCSGGQQSGELRSVNTPEYREKITPRHLFSVNDFYGELTDAIEEADRAKIASDVRTYDDLTRLRVRYGTIVLDHASGFSDLILSEIIGKPVPAQKGWGIATQQQYGQLALQAKDALRKLLSLSCNVVIVAQQRTFGGREDGMDPEMVKPTVGAALTPSILGWLNPACDYVLQTFKRPKMIKKQTKVSGQTIETEARDGIEYCLRCEPHDVFMTKFRIPKGRHLPPAIVDPTYDKIQAVISGKTKS